MSLLSDLTTLFGNAYSTAALAATDWVTALTNSLVSLGGKAGGQTIYGSTQANESLALLPNPSAGGVLTLSDALRIVEIPSVSASSVVATNTANGLVALAYSETPGNNTIPRSTAAGKLAAGWGGDASTLATLDANSKVVQDPANAQTTAAASKIPLADTNGKLAAGWGSAIPGAAAQMLATDSSGNCTIGPTQINGGDGGIQIGAAGTGDRASYVGLGGHGNPWETGYQDGVVWRDAGENGAMKIKNAGTGGILLNVVGNGALTFKTGNTERASISGAGVFTIDSDTLILTTAKTPASAAAAGVAGQIAWDASYVYVCVSANSWKRAAIAAW